MEKIFQKAKGIIPGFLVCVALALIARIIGSFVPTVGAATFAIFLGILAGNTFLDRPVMETGTKFSESRLLEYSIVLMGATLNLSDVLSVGSTGIAFILLQMSVTIAAAFFIGRKLGFTKKFSLLMCAGNAVCGSSAIGSVSPIVKPDSKDKGLSITIVNITGTFLMILLPIFTGILYQHEALHTSAMIGGTLQSIGQVIASAKFVTDEVVELSTVFKIIRIIFLVGVAFMFSHMNTEEGKKLYNKKEHGTHEKIKAGIPWFIIGFFLFSIVNSLNVIPEAVSSAAHSVSGEFEIIALAAIGMRVKFKTIISEGPKAMLYGGMVGACQIACAAALIFFLFR